MNEELKLIDKGDQVILKKSIARHAYKLLFLIVFFTFGMVHCLKTAILILVLIL